MGAWLPACRMSATTVWSARSWKATGATSPRDCSTRPTFISSPCDMVDLFERAGFEIVDMQVYLGPDTRSGASQDALTRFVLGGCTSPALPPKRLKSSSFTSISWSPNPAELKRTATPTRATSNSPTIAASGRLAERPVASCVQEKPFRVMTKSKARKIGQACAGLPDAADFIPRQFRSGLVDRRYAADALEHVGHAVNRIHEYGVGRRRGRDRAHPGIRGRLPRLLQGPDWR